MYALGICVNRGLKAILASRIQGQTSLDIHARSSKTSGSHKVCHLPLNANLCVIGDQFLGPALDNASNNDTTIFEFELEVLMRKYNCEGTTART